MGSSTPVAVTITGMGVPEETDIASARAEALDAVSEALQWQLADARWQVVEQVLVAMDAALAAGDVQALMAATAELELAGPLRLTRISVAQVAAPPQIRDLLNRMVFSLGGITAGQQPTGSAGAGDDGASRS
jgi:hypothetical protein